MQKYYARAKPTNHLLKPGEWTELTHAQYDSVRKSVKATSDNFVKGGIEGLVVTVGNIAAYQYLYPELYEMLSKEATV